MFITILVPEFDISCKTLVTKIIVIVILKLALALKLLVIISMVTVKNSNYLKFKVNYIGDILLHI